MSSRSSTTRLVPPIVSEKLAAFEQIQADFEGGFQFIQEVHGQRRIEPFPVLAIVRYFHALWISGCKDCLLSVPHTIERYEGRQVLTLLRTWQRGDSAEVVDFLQRKLDMVPFGQITRQVEETRHAGDVLERVLRLAHGRLVLLNRGFNLHYALEAIFTLSSEALMEAVHAAAAQYGHSPEQIERQLAEMDTPLYAPLAHPALAQRNMLVMNALGVRITDNPADRPGHRTERVARPTVPDGPYAQHLISGEVELTPPAYSTSAYIPAGDADHAILNGPTTFAEPTGEIERHPGTM
jgi:hypothetical protein